MNDPFNPTAPEPSLIASICRCSSPQEHARRAEQSAAESVRYAEQRAEARVKELQARTPNADEYDIEGVEELAPYLVLKVRYPSCKACAYEGVKVLVIHGRTLKDVITWKRIDPHFRDPLLPFSLREAPSPVARFPGSESGWKDAIEWAKSKR